MDCVGGGGGGGKAEPGPLAVDTTIFLFSLLSSRLFFFCKGTHTPRSAHSARWGWGISFVVACAQGRRPVSFVAL